MAVALVPGPQNGCGFSWNLTKPIFFDSGFASICISNEYSRSGSIESMFFAGLPSVSRLALTGFFFAQHRIMSQMTFVGALVFIEDLCMCV